MPEQAGTSEDGRGLRDWVTVAQGALLLVAVILIGTLLSGAGRPRAVRARRDREARRPGPGGFQGGPRRRSAARADGAGTEARQAVRQEQGRPARHRGAEGGAGVAGRKRQRRPWLRRRPARRRARHGGRHPGAGAEAGRRQDLRQPSRSTTRPCCGRSSCSSRTTTGSRSSPPSTTPTSRCPPWRPSTARPTRTSASTSAACRRS